MVQTDMMFFLVTMIVLSIAAIAIFGALAWVAIIDRRETLMRQSTRGEYVYAKKSEAKTVRAKGFSHA